MVYRIYHDSIPFPCSYLIHQFSVEWYTHCAEEKSCVSIGLCGRFDCNVESGDHLGWVHIVVNLNFWEQNYPLSIESKTYVSAAVASSACHMLALHVQIIEAMPHP